MAKVPSVQEVIIRKATSQLGIKDKQIWYWWNYDKLTQKEIAHNLQISQQAVAKHLARIQKELTALVIANSAWYDKLKEEIQEEIDCANYEPE